MAATRLIILVCLGILFLFFGCTQKRKQFLFPEKPLSEGDLVFRRGTGLASRAVLTVDQKGGGYSHVGIVVKDSGNWKVVHAVPGEADKPGEPDRVKMEPIGLFFACDRAVSGAVMRVGASPAILSRAARRAVGLYREGVLFDHHYDKEDTTAMYCTELIEFVYSHAGLDLTEKKCSRTGFPGFSGVYILPSDIQSSKYLKLVESF